MKCRMNITGRKTWIDNNNLYGTRPATVEINLLRNGTIYKTVTVDSKGNGQYTFDCLPITSNSGQKYQYSIDESPIPVGYISKIQGYNVINTLENITITGTKTWNDDNNATLTRPASITLNLLQNEKQLHSITVVSPANEQSTVNFSFPTVPFANDQGEPFVYTIEELIVAGYTKTADGFNIINTLIKESPIFTLSLATQDTTVPQASMYKVAPITMPVRGNQSNIMYMTDKIIIKKTSSDIITLAKWAPAEAMIGDPVEWFKAGNGIPLTNGFVNDLINNPNGTFANTIIDSNGVSFNINGQQIFVDGEYVIYLENLLGYGSVASITVGNIRDGSTLEKSYALVDVNASRLRNDADLSKFYMNINTDANIKSMGYNKYYELAENINLDYSGNGTDVTNWTAIGTGAGWEPPLDDTNQFMGDFEGNNNTVSNLYINNPTTAGQGLFGVIGSEGKVSNINIYSVKITSTDAWIIGTIAGQNQGIINNVTVTGTAGSIIAGGDSVYFVGGIVGINNGTITGVCSVSNIEKLEAYMMVAGFVGVNIKYNLPNGIVTPAILHGAFTVKDIGIINGTGSTTGTYGSAYVGGFCGYNLGGTIGNTNDSTISVLNIDTISGYMAVGGFIGCQYNSFIYGTCSVLSINTITGSSAIGGFIGDNEGKMDGTFTVSNIIQVNGDGAVGGFAGAIDQGTSETRGYFILDNVKQIIGRDTNIGGFVGVCRAQLGSAINIKIKGIDLIGGECNAVGGLIGSAVYLFDGISKILLTKEQVKLIQGLNYVGGIVGELQVGKISECANQVPVTGQSFVGGIVGSLNGIGTIDSKVSSVASEPSSIENCYNTGSVDGQNYVGGILGGDKERNSTHLINYCYNAGAVGNQTTSNSAGIIGIGSDILSVKNCLSMRDLMGGTNIARIFNCCIAADSDNNYAYENLQINGVIVPAGTPSNKDGGNKTFAELTGSTTSFTDINWDFTNIWQQVQFTADDGTLVNLPTLKNLELSPQNPALVSVPNK